MWSSTHCTHILAGVEDLESILEILSFLFFSTSSLQVLWGFPQVENFLSLQPGDIKMYLGDVSSLVDIGLTQKIHLLHASLMDFLIDPTCSKEFWINPQVQHTDIAFAHHCLQLLQLKGKQFVPSVVFL